MRPFFLLTVAACSASVRYAGGAKTIATDAARVATAAGGAVRRGVVAAMRQAEIDSQRQAEPDDFRLGKANKRRVDVESAAILHCRFGGNVGELLEGVNELRPAIRIAGVIDGVNSDINVEGADRFGPCQSQ